MINNEIAILKIWICDRNVWWDWMNERTKKLLDLSDDMKSTGRDNFCARSYS